MSNEPHPIGVRMPQRATYGSVAWTGSRPGQRRYEGEVQPPVLDGEVRQPPGLRDQDQVVASGLGAAGRMSLMTMSTREHDG